MSRYFIELSYMGTAYSGFQVQENSRTVQGELEKALAVFFRKQVVLTGSSRTDSGVHAMQNYFHFDEETELNEAMVYNINALLPADIAVRLMKRMDAEAHCRFDALWRQYRYCVYAKKDVFLRDRAYYFPYTLDMEQMQRAALVLMEYTDFRSFSKRNSQVKTFNCKIMQSGWAICGDHFEYRVRANRFLRGMVRGLVGTMLQVGRGKISVDDFRAIVVRGDASAVDFSVPGRGLCLEKVGFEERYFG